MPWPRWAGGRPRLISNDDVEFIVATATTRPNTLGLAFSHWSVRKLAAHLGECDHRCPAGRARPLPIGRERLRQLLRSRGVSFQRTRTSEGVQRPGQEHQARPDRGSHPPLPGPLLRLPDQFGPLSIRPCHGVTWAPESHPDRLGRPVGGAVGEVGQHVVVAPLQGPSVTTWRCTRSGRPPDAPLLKYWATEGRGPHPRRTSVSKATGLTRGDRNRKALRRTRSGAPAPQIDAPQPAHRFVEGLIQSCGAQPLEQPGPGREPPTHGTTHPLKLAVARRLPVL